MFPSALDVAKSMQASKEADEKKKEQSSQKRALRRIKHGATPYEEGMFDFAILEKIHRDSLKLSNIPEEVQEKMFAAIANGEYFGLGIDFDGSLRHSPLRNCANLTNILVAEKRRDVQVESDLFFYINELETRQITPSNWIKEFPGRRGISDIHTLNLRGVQIQEYMFLQHDRRAEIRGIESKMENLEDEESIRARLLNRLLRSQKESLIHDLEDAEAKLASQQQL